ncbi:MAG: hypothetical protein KBB21_32935, partial [Nannocystaceae bacterium]|nr:hypothetical protein [Nannocystaceae bacterium]
MEAALALLAEGAQPAFVAWHRSDRVGGLAVRELERIQAAAVRAAAFEFQRESLRQELRDRGALHPALDTMIRAAVHAIDLDDVRVLLRKRKRGPAAKARGQGLAPLAGALLQVGTDGPLADATLAELRQHRRADEAPREGGGRKRKRRRGRKRDAAAATGTDDGAQIDGGGDGGDPGELTAAPHDDDGAAQADAGDHVGGGHEDDDGAHDHHDHDHDAAEDDAA